MAQLNTYLDKFRSTIPAIQSRQVVAILQEYRRRGQIKTLEQFKTRFADLTAHLQQQVIQPSLRLFLGEYRQIIDSETYNFMMDRIRDDLITAFLESDNIDEIQDTHHELVTKIIFRGIQLALNELDKKITMAEILNHNSRHAFDNVQIGITNGTQIPTSDRRDPNAGIIYSDPILGGTIDEAAAYFGGITLGSDSATKLKIKSIRQVSGDTQADMSAFSVSLDPDNRTLSNLLDGSSGTFWETSMLSPDVIPGGAWLKLELELPTKTVFNTLFIEPALDKSVTLEKISILGPNNTITDVFTESTALNGSVEIRFKPQVSSRVYLLFHQKTYSVLEFAIQAGRTLEARRNDLTIQIDQETVDRYLGDKIQTDLLRSVVGVNTVDPDQQEKVRYIEYRFVLDNIALSQSVESEISVFASAPMDVSVPSAIGLEVQETRPVLTAGSTEVSFDRDAGRILASTTPPLLGAFSTVWADATGVNDHYQASVEYWVRKIDYNERGAIVAVSTMPILPLGTQMVLHERFHPTSTPVSLVNSVGKLRFYAELDAVPGSQTVLDPSDDFREFNSIYRDTIRVYRNGTEIPNKDEFDTEEDGWNYLESESQTSPTTIEPMSTVIQIENPSNTDRYTVSYIPKQSNTLFLTAANAVGESVRAIPLTANQTHIHGRENIIFCSAATKTDSIARSKIYLTIILRKNTSTRYVAPTVREYTLYTGSTKPEKLQGFA